MTKASKSDTINGYCNVLPASSARKISSPQASGQTVLRPGAGSVMQLADQGRTSKEALHLPCCLYVCQF
jgi:hypothetical protein